MSNNCLIVKKTTSCPSSCFYEPLDLPKTTCQQTFGIEWTDDGSYNNCTCINPYVNCQRDYTNQLQHKLNCCLYRNNLPKFCYTEPVTQKQICVVQDQLPSMYCHPNWNYTNDCCSDVIMDEITRYVKNNIPLTDTMNKWLELPNKRDEYDKIRAKHCDSVDIPDTNGSIESIKNTPCYEWCNRNKDTLEKCRKKREEFCSKNPNAITPICLNFKELYSPNNEFLRAEMKYCTTDYHLIDNPICYKLSMQHDVNKIQSIKEEYDKKWKEICDKYFESSNTFMPQYSSYLKEKCSCQKKEDIDPVCYDETCRSSGYKTYNQLTPLPCPAICLAKINAIAQNVANIENVTIIQQCSQINDQNINTQIKGKIETDIQKNIENTISVAIFSNSDIPNSMKKYEQSYHDIYREARKKYDTILADKTVPIKDEMLEMILFKVKQMYNDAIIAYSKIEKINWANDTPEVLANIYTDFKKNYGQIFGGDFDTFAQSIIDRINDFHKKYVAYLSERATLQNQFTELKSNLKLLVESLEKKYQYVVIISPNIEKPPITEVNALLNRYYNINLVSDLKRAITDIESSQLSIKLNALNVEYDEVLSPQNQKRDEMIKETKKMLNTFESEISRIRSLDANGKLTPINLAIFRAINLENIKRLYNIIQSTNDYNVLKESYIAFISEAQIIKSKLNSIKEYVPIENYKESSTPSSIIIWIIIGVLILFFIFGIIGLSMYLISRQNKLMQKNKVK